MNRYVLGRRRFYAAKTTTRIAYAPGGVWRNKSWQRKVEVAQPMDWIYLRDMMDWEPIYEPEMSNPMDVDVPDEMDCSDDF